VLLAYDIGNTNIVVGLLDGERIVGRWRFTTHRQRTADEMRFEARSVLAEAGVDPADIDGIAAASVVPSLNSTLAAGLRPLFETGILWVDARTSPIRLDVDEPWSVGADRIANCVAGHALYGGPLLVIDFGTAITFDLVSEDGVFLGGAIAPEMQLAADALTDRAAQLFAVSLDVPDTVIGRTTASNLQAGLVLGFFDLVAGRPLPRGGRPRSPRRRHRRKGRALPPAHRLDRALRSRSHAEGPPALLAESTRLAVVCPVSPSCGQPITAEGAERRGTRSSDMRGTHDRT
jgi:type III pantothenate kinase